MRKYFYAEKHKPMEWDGNKENPYNHWIEERMTKVMIDRERFFIVLKIYLITPNRKFFLDKCDPTASAYIDTLEKEFPESIPVVFIHGNHVVNMAGDGIDYARQERNK
jgi:hypothetical protein